MRHFGDARATFGTDSWITPKPIIDRLGPFDLDPCASDPQPWPCATEAYTTGGLEKPWRGFVWLNPPYGRALSAWLGRLAQHGNGIALTFARTETRAFEATVWPVAACLLFVRGRVKFFRPDGTGGENSATSSVLIGYWQLACERLLAARDLGFFVDLHASRVATAIRTERRPTP